MRPTPGQPYTTKQDDTLSKIAGIAYGVPSKWRVIFDITTLQTTLTETGIIPVGTVLNIPLDTEISVVRQQQLQRGLR